jgi:hypothetical protein
VHLEGPHGVPFARGADDQRAGTRLDRERPQQGERRAVGQCSHDDGHRRALGQRAARRLAVGRRRIQHDIQGRGAALEQVDQLGGRLAEHDSAVRHADGRTG